jgi:S-adenosylhomocysteine hydrolase
MNETEGLVNKGFFNVEKQKKFLTLMYSAVREQGKKVDRFRNPRKNIIEILSNGRVVIIIIFFSFPW